MSTTVQKKVNNAAYRTTIAIGASRLKQVTWYFTNLVFFTNPFNVLSSLKVSLLKAFGARVGVGVVIKPSVNIKFPWKLQVGDHTWIGEDVWIDNLSDVTIGSHVTLSQGCLLLTGSHDAARETFDFLSQPIVLEDGVWIGARAVVGGGARCGTHSILGINSVAESDLEPYTIYKGNPAIPVLRRIVS
ncbi:WcaF family extracellular polysaccharide biosynthesis acetyltransferase [Puia sp.]|jgi:putative colanic acid biosynthesis acetyltransferase WcaF|uniref:WcaF family extracellular polysaccharide biosynthesis acetyltransferase n=1 Tax=Puia sp. TaxID=2045100 RepID=UPI002F41CBB5